MLGLGNIGALAGKPVMEGKGVLFKNSPVWMSLILKSMRPTGQTGGYYCLSGADIRRHQPEDIKAPECFYIEKKLRERMKIPVFHDDQHGTAIISTAAVLNGLRIVNKAIGDVRLVVSGAGAASVACMNLMVLLGLKRDNIIVCDSKGVIYKGREANMAETKAAYAIDDNGMRTLADAMRARIFSSAVPAGRADTGDGQGMARDPLILALANPEPEILPPLALAVRPDAIICTGRSDYPNRSITCSASRLFSVVRLMSAQRRLMKR